VNGHGIELLEQSWRTRDGVAMAADVFRPLGPGRYPVLLMRTPYDRRRAQSSSYASPYWFARHGFVVVVEDVRGRGESEGEFAPFEHELADGHESVEWAASLPWSNGRVAMYGLSYAGVTQMQAAVSAPPSLASIAPAMTSSEYYEGWTYRGGALELAFAVSWAVSLGQDVARRAGDAGAFNLLATTYDRELALAYAALPLSELAPLRSHPYTPFFRDWLDHPTNDGYWRRWALQQRYDRIAASGLHIGGWWDIFLAGTLENFTGITAATTTTQRCVVGPWTHAIDESQLHCGRMGGVVPNPLDRWHLDWFNHTLRDADDPWKQPVNLYVLRADRWLATTTWPPPDTKEETWFLASDGLANSDRGDGRLEQQAPESSPPDVFTYDPLSPVPSLGGASCCSAAIAPMGPAAQARIEASNDVLIYTTEPFERDRLLDGRPVVALHVTSTAPDTDFVARLCVVDTTGLSVNAADGIQRVGALAVDGEPIDLSTPTRITISLQPLCVHVGRGERLRLQITSSSFPRWDRNFNTAKAPATCGPFDAVIARQHVLHDRDHRSALLIGVLEP
jgi:putative CocE/NonD family hydrolase